MLTQERLTQEKLKELLSYNPNTGVFTRKVRGKNQVCKGDIAGSKRLDGYLRISINNKKYYNHRLAWLFIFGYLPELEIDHIDRNPLNNCINNLREASQQCNLRNCGNFKHNTSGVKGVHWYVKRNKWQANIMINQKTKHLGYYEDFDNAVCARLTGEQACNWDGCDNSSPAYQYVVKNIQNKCEVIGYVQSV